MAIIVVKNKKIQATHPDHVNIPEEAYPGAERIYMPGPESDFVPGEVFDPETRPAAAKETEARILRDKLLAGSDWTQLGDAPLSAALKAEWVTYRQALRDLDLQAAKIVWPTPPGKTGRLQ